MISSSRKKRSVPRGWWLVGAFMALVLLAASLTRPALEQVLVRALSPALALRNTLVASDATLLRAEVSRLEAAVADRELLYRENLDLKARLGRPAPLFSE